LYASPNIITVIKSGGMRWAKHVARLGETRIHTKSRLENLRRRERLKELGVDIRIKLELIFG